SDFATPARRGAGGWAKAERVRKSRMHALWVSRKIMLLAPSFFVSRLVEIELFRHDIKWSLEDATYGVSASSFAWEVQAPRPDPWHWGSSLSVLLAMWSLTGTRPPQSGSLWFSRRTRPPDRPFPRRV